MMLGPDLSELHPWIAMLQLCRQALRLQPGTPSICVMNNARHCQVAVRPFPPHISKVRNEGDRAVGTTLHR